jgi:drug/metabolite transporter (DMT)-like permease
LVLGLTGLVGNTTLWFWGLKHTTALNAEILVVAALRRRARRSPPRRPLAGPRAS